MHVPVTGPRLCVVFHACSVTSSRQAHREVEHADDAARLREEEAAEAPPGGSGGGEALHVYPCSQCSKIFKRKYALKEHVR